MDRGFHLTADGLGKTRKRLQRGTMNVNLPLYKKQLPGLEEAGVNQATPWPESGADRAAASRENPALFSTPNQYNPNWIFQIGNGFGFFIFFQSQRYNILDFASKVNV